MESLKSADRLAARDLLRRFQAAVSAKQPRLARRAGRAGTYCGFIGSSGISPPGRSVESSQQRRL